MDDSCEKMMAFYKLIALTRCQENGGTFVESGGFELAVFRLANPERVMVLDNTCPHAGGNLAGGEVDGEGKIVTCPWHQWEFFLATGVCTHSPLAHVRRYPAEIRDGFVWIDLQEQTGL